MGSVVASKKDSQSYAGMPRRGQGGNSQDPSIKRFLGLGYAHNPLMKNMKNNFVCLQFYERVQNTFAPRAPFSVSSPLTGRKGTFR